MWNFCNPIDSTTMKIFETAFGYTINPPLRDFLMAHNGGRTRQCNIITATKERRLDCLLDFRTGGNAWEINRRMRKILGNKCIVIGVDRSENFLCVRRNQRQQDFVLWNHITGELEECTEQIPFTVLNWTAIT